MTHDAGEYRQAFDRAERTMLQVLARRLPAAEVEAQVQQVLTLTGEERRQRLRSDPYMRRLEVAIAVGERCRSLVRQNPHAALLAAEAAVDSAMTVGAHGLLRTVVYDQRALAWGLFANALRLGEALGKAEKAWEKSDRFLALGSGDPLLLARLLDLKGSLRRAQRRLEEAESLLRQAISLFSRLRDFSMAGRAGLNLGSTLFYAGKISEATQETLIAARIVDVIQEPSLAVTTVHNLAIFLAEGGAYRSALCLLDDGFCLYVSAGSPIDQLRGAWLRGRLHAALEEWHAAERCFRAVQRGFVAQRLPYLASLAGLELAVVYLHLGKNTEAQGLAEEMLPVFVSKEIPREASAALLLFVEAARREDITLEQVERLVADLKAHRGGHGKFLT